MKCALLDYDVIKIAVDVDFITRTYFLAATRFDFTVQFDQPALDHQFGLAARFDSTGL